jgi:protein-arginine kinase activator protein McsA
MQREHTQAVHALTAVDSVLYKQNPKAVIKEKMQQMNQAVQRLDFETAAILRDEIQELEKISPSRSPGSVQKK